MVEYPEHQKLRAVRAQTQAAGAFFDWLQNERGYEMVGPDGVYVPIDELLADWKGIDARELEREKLAMLEELRAGASGAAS